MDSECSGWEKISWILCTLCSLRFLSFFVSNGLDEELSTHFFHLPFGRPSLGWLDTVASFYKMLHPPLGEFGNGKVASRHGEHTLPSFEQRRAFVWSPTTTRRRRKRRSRSKVECVRERLKPEETKGAKKGGDWTQQHKFVLFCGSLLFLLLLHPVHSRNYIYFWLMLLCISE